MEDQILLDNTIDKGKLMKIGGGPWERYDEAAVDAALDASQRKRPMEEVVLEALNASISEITSVYNLLHKMHPTHWTRDASDSALLKILRGVLNRVKEQGVTSGRA